MGTAPVPGQGRCKADVYVSHSEDPHDVCDSVAESDEEHSGSSAQMARGAWVMPEGTAVTVPVSVSSSGGS